MPDVLEHGHVYFLYRPKVERDSVEGAEDVQRLYMVLSPRGKKVYRQIVIGAKALPAIGDGGERQWGFIDDTDVSATRLRENFAAVRYHTRTRGMRTLPEARPAGEGVYVIVRHGNHTHFAYALELPRETGPVQHELQIPPEASYIISVKNPKQPSPPGAGLGSKQKASLPKSLQKRFRGRRFMALEIPDLLDHPGLELLLIGAQHDAGNELEITLDTRDEDATTAEIFTDLRLRKSRHPTEPLFEGRWA